MESSKEVSEKVNLEKRDIPCKAAPKEETKEVTVSAEKIQKTDLLGKTTEASIKVSTSYLCTNCTNLFPGVLVVQRGVKSWGTWSHEWTRFAHSSRSWNYQIDTGYLRSKFSVVFTLSRNNMGKKTFVFAFWPCTQLRKFDVETFPQKISVRIVGSPRKPRGKPIVV